MGWAATRMPIARPLVTIGMSVRNCAKTVGRAVRSILNQSCSDWELQLIDDGSSDDTLSELLRFRDRRILVQHHGENKGLPARLNESLNRASGEYYARMDGDDVCYPHRLEVQIAYLQTHAEVDLVGGGLLVFGGAGDVKGRRMPPEDHSAICRKPYSGFPLAHPTYVGKTSWFRRYGYSESAVRCEDQDLLLRAFRFSQFANVQCIVLGYQEQMNLRTILASRRCLARTISKAYARNRQPVIALRGFVEQYLKGAVDVAAASLNLQSALQRHRATPATAQDVTQWRDVWQTTSDQG